MSTTETLSVIHGMFNLSTGLWPVFHRRSFEAVTGPKKDFWLVRTVGLLIAVSGLALTLAGGRRRVTPEICVLGGGVAGSLLAVDLIYSGCGRISRIYLADAAVEAALTAAWLKRSW
ncbi:MAG: hypothetical protein QOJ99_6149 [Bryobacterales bacterium]|jgi:hypothetical protein|nr:hypothetical protein [Bryobacterales bacterium]